MSYANIVQSVTEATSLDEPAAHPPEGILSDLDNPPNMNTASYVISTVLLTLATISVAIRLYAKVICLREVLVPDGETTCP